MSGSNPLIRKVMTAVRNCVSGFILMIAATAFAQTAGPQVAITGGPPFFQATLLEYAGGAIIFPISGDDVLLDIKVTGTPVPWQMSLVSSGWAPVNNIDLQVRFYEQGAGSTLGPVITGWIPVGEVPGVIFGSIDFSNKKKVKVLIFARYRVQLSAQENAGTYDTQLTYIIAVP